MSEVRFEPCARRVRATLGGVTVIDSSRVQYGYKDGWPPYPAYYVPVEDVRMDVLEQRGATQALSEPVNGLVTFRWKAFDGVFEESEQVFVHPRDPRHRVDVVASDRHIEVFVEGEKVADSRRPSMLFETGLPVRYYLPKTDVRMELLTSTTNRTGCPYKGFADYWSVTVNGEVHENIVWGYTTPLPDAMKVAGLVCFYNEKVDIKVDGVLQERPESPF